LCAVVDQLALNNDSDALLWCYEKSEIYSSQSLYVVINFKGVTPVHIPAIWNIVVPPKIQLFLWLLSHNKLAIVDNLNKKGLSKPVQCCFYSENESIVHPFFECDIVKTICKYVSNFLGFDIGSDYLLVASKWLHKDKFYNVNIISYAVLRGVWLIRIDFVFNKHVWSDVKLI
jgi:hypothetical protein